MKFFLKPLKNYNGVYAVEINLKRKDTVCWIEFIHKDPVLLLNTCSGCLDNDIIGVDNYD